MSTEVATKHGGSDLTIRDDQSFWSDKQVAALRALGVKDATNGDLAVFFHQATRTGLDPFAKQIYMIGRWSREGTKQTIQTGIDGYRLIARRAADRRNETLEYEDTLWCGEDGKWRDVWLSRTAPAAAKVVVLRNGGRFPGIATWAEYVQTTKDGAPNSMWQRMGANQLAKCAEALALRKAFPQDLSGIYTDDEMGQADNNLPTTQPADSPQSTAETPKAKRTVQRAKAPAPDLPDVVHDTPKDPAPEAPAEDIVDADVIPDRITKDQMDLLAEALTQAGHGTVAEKLMALTDFFGRDIKNPTELSYDEATVILDFLVGEPATS